ncbi:putative holin [Yersinia enterocolitica]|uniref:putative holin n=1 Tax=Yersinia enterocolitica TaxID=630 RepID=UPI00398D586B
MYEPLTLSAGVTAASVGVTFASLFPEATPAVVICSLAGAALYVLSSRPHRLWRQVLFALISFIGGIYCADTASEIIAALINVGLNQLSTPVTIRVTPAIGALVASTVCVSVLLRVMSRYHLNPDSNGKEDD